MNITERNTKAEIITEALAMIDGQSESLGELRRQRNALAIATALLLAWLLI
ncbi:MAG: hypothetical protein ACO242_04295 [Candidatus Fonsibacter ubiquis]